MKKLITKQSNIIIFSVIVLLLVIAISFKQYDTRDSIIKMEEETQHYETRTVGTESELNEFVYTKNDSNKTVILQRYKANTTTTNLDIYEKYTIGEVEYTTIIEKSGTESFFEDNVIGRVDFLENVKWKGNVENFFRNCKHLDIVIFRNVQYEDSSNTSLKNMFYECSSLRGVYFQSAEFKGIEDVSYMFYGCEQLQSVNIPTTAFAKSNITDMSYMFYNCKKLTDVNLENIDTTNVTNMESMLYNCTSLENINVNNWNVGKVTNMKNMFVDCKMTDIDLSKWNTSQVTDMSGMFNKCHYLTNSSLNSLSNWDTSKVTDMNGMFYLCESLTSVSLNNWNTSNVTNMSNMFGDCFQLNTIEISNWDTSNVTDMNNMFSTCLQLNQIDINDWDTSKVTNMYRLFLNCEKLTTVNIADWNVSKVEDMSQMFYGCKVLKNIDISKWNTPELRYVEEMFCICSAIERLDISNFDLSKCKRDYDMFKLCNFDVLVTPKAISEDMLAELPYVMYDDYGEEYRLLPTTSKTIYKERRAITQYTVTFVSDGQTLKTERVNRGQSATAPVTPTKPGYTFAGWDKDFSNVTSDLTVNAKWTPATNTVYTVEQYRQNLTLDDYDFIGSDTYEGTTGETVTVGITGIEGFSVDENNTNNKLSGVVAADGSLVLKVYYDRGVYSVTLNPNEGTIPEGQNVTRYTYGVGATLPTPVRQGYTFAGWYIGEDLTGNAIHTIGTEATGDKTYFAKWEAGEGTAYTVEYYKENLQGTYDRVEADTQHLTGTTGQSVTVTPNIYEGFTAKEDNILTGIIAADGSLVIRVYYDRNIYTITYDPNYSVPGGVARPVPVIHEFKYGESVEIANIHVTRTGYNFIGWNTETIGNGTNYQVGDTYSKNESTTLYAQWRANTYSVTLNTNEGTIPEEENVTSYTYGVGATLPTPTRVGYTFAGWYTNAELEENNVAQITETDIGDKTYYAKWEEGEGTAYKVEHYKQNPETNAYEKVATDDLTAKTGLTVTATPKTYEGFHENTTHEDRVASGVVSADGSLVLRLYYDINQYIVTFKDSDQVVKEEIVAHGEDATAPTITKDKYVLRWDKAYNNVTSDLTVNANWLKDTDGDGIPDIEDNDTQVAYKVKHYKQVGNTNEYRLEEIEELTGHLGSQVTAIAKRYEGYVENISVKERIPSGEVVEDGSLELRLFYDTIKYTVTFVSDGQTLSTQNISHGAAATAPTAPTKEGYTFAGWDKDFTNVTSNLEVKAIWTRNQEEPKQVGYKVEHYKQNTKTNSYEKVATEELTGTPGSTVTAVAKTYEGFHENTSNGDRVATGVVAEDGSLVLKLYYDINKYTVTFKDGDQVVKTETVEHGGSATPPTITKPGYILSWDKQVDNVTGDTTFTAVWTKDPNYVDPNANDGKEEKPSFLPQTGESYIVVGMISVVMSVAILVYLKYRKIDE